MSLDALHALSRSYTGKITPDVAAPFLEMEKQRTRATQARTLAAPLGAMAMHLPLLPAGAVAPAAAASGASAVSPASAILEHLGQNSVFSGGGDFAGSIAGHMTPIFLLGGLGGLGGIGLSYGVSKLLRALAKRKLRKQQASAAAENPILGL